MTDIELEDFFYGKYNEALSAQTAARRSVEQGYGGITHPALYNSADWHARSSDSAMLFAMRAVEKETAERSALVAGDAESPEGPEFAALIREEFGI
jgi:hypothetical protein